MVRLEQKLGQPNRLLSSELANKARNEGISLLELKEATARIITTRAHFDDLDKTLATVAVKFAVVDNIPINQSADLVMRLAYDLEMGSDALKMLGEAAEAAKQTPNLTGAGGVQLVIDMTPYWNQLHRLTGRPLGKIVLEKAATVLTVQKILYTTYPGDPDPAKVLLRATGLSPEGLTDEKAQATSQLFSASEWASIVNRFNRGEPDVVFKQMHSRLAADFKQIDGR